MRYVRFLVSKIQRSTHYATIADCMTDQPDLNALRGTGFMPLHRELCSTMHVFAVDFITTAIFRT